MLFKFQTNKYWPDKCCIVCFQNEKQSSVPDCWNHLKNYCELNKGIGEIYAICDILSVCYLLLISHQDIWGLSFRWAFMISWELCYISIFRITVFIRILFAIFVPDSLEIHSFSSFFFLILFHSSNLSVCSSWWLNHYRNYCFAAHQPNYPETFPILFVFLLSPPFQSYNQWNITFDRWCDKNWHANNNIDRNASGPGQNAFINLYILGRV